MAEDRARANDRDIEAGRGGFVAQLLGPQLGPPVRLDGPARRIFDDGVRLGDSKDGARRCVHDLGHTRVARRNEHVGRADDVDRFEQLAIARQRHLCDVVQYHVDAVTGRANGREVADVAGDVLHLAFGQRRRVEVENAHLVAPGQRLLGDDRPEVAAAAGDQDRASHQSGSPFASDQRIAARVPSNRSVGGS